ncbi:hypothetical protein RYX36_035055 [Vicia faba]
MNRSNVVLLDLNVSLTRFKTGKTTTPQLFSHLSQFHKRWRNFRSITNEEEKFAESSQFEVSGELMKISAKAMKFLAVFPYFRRDDGMLKVMMNWWRSLLKVATVGEEEKVEYW